MTTSRIRKSALAVVQRALALPLSVQLALLFSALSIGATLVAVLAVGAHAGAALTQRIQLSLADSARQVVGSLDRGVYERQREVQLLAARVSQLPQSGLRAELDSVLRSYRYYAWLGVADLSGRVVAGSDGLLEGQDVSQRPWFPAGMKGPALTDVHRALMLEKVLHQRSTEPLRFFDVSAPLKDAQGAVTGVLASHVFWNWADDVSTAMLADRPAASRSELLIISRDGEVLLGPPKVIGQRLRRDSIARAANGDAGALSEYWEGEGQFLVGFNRTVGYESSPGLGWTVLVRQPIEHAYAPVRSLQAILVTTGLALAAVFSWLGAMVAHSISRPLHQLAGSASAWEAGKLVELPDVRGYREVAKLSEAMGAANQRILAASSAQATSERRLQRILQSALDAIITVDVDQRIVMFNDAATAMFGLRESEAIGQQLDVLIPASKRAAHSDSFRQFAAGADRTRVMAPGRPVWGVRRDGTEFPIEASISSAQGEDPPYFTVILRDITDRIAAHEALLESNRRLRDFSDRFDRTLLSQLEARQTRIARELHDSLGSNLAGILMLIATFEKTNLSEVQQASATRLRNHVKEAAEMTRSLARGLMPVSELPGSLNTALQQFAAAKHSPPDFACTFDATGEAPSLTTEAGNHLYRIAQEAVSNAIRHGHATEVAIDLEVDAAVLRLTIWNDGTPIAKASLDQQGDGIGLKSMRARSLAIGAEISWMPGSAKGTAVQIELRLGPSSEPARSGQSVGA